jgi:hypothetical protein
MRILLIIGTLLLFLIAVSSAQDPWPVNSHPWEYGNVCWDDEQRALNHFAEILKKDPDLVGYIVVYAGRISCRGEAKYRAERAKKWVVKQGVSPDRVIAMDGGYRVEVQTVLHLQNKKDPAYEPYSMLNKEAVSISRRHCVDKVFELKLCPNR